MINSSSYAITPHISPLRLALCRKAGFLSELATCCDYADCLLQRNKPDVGMIGKWSNLR